MGERLRRHHAASWAVIGACALAVVLGLSVLWSSEQIVWTEGGVIG